MTPRLVENGLVEAIKQVWIAMERAIEGVWTFDPPIGRLQLRSLAGQIDAAQPEQGLTGVSLDRRDLNATLFSIRREIATDAPARLPQNPWPATLADSYARGNDLVASYAASSDWPYAPEIYWSAETLGSLPSVISSLSLVISVQTHLLDTYPEIIITSELAAAEMFELSAFVDGAKEIAIPLGRRQSPPSAANMCCLLWRLRDENVSYIEIVPNSDYRQLLIERRGDGICRASWRLFADFLEKGVIRRARLHSVFLPRENDIQLAAACCRAMERRPLPLTT
jgi:hypothetical protein